MTQDMEDPTPETNIQEVPLIAKGRVNYPTPIDESFQDLS